MKVNSGIAVLRGLCETNQGGTLTKLFPNTWYLALTADNAAPSATDTTLASELTTNGLGRQIATLSHTTGQNNWDYSATFTYTGTGAQAINKVGLFDASSGGNLIAEELFGATVTVSISGDTVSVKISLNIA